MTTRMRAPTGLAGLVVTSSGSHTIDANGFVVVDPTQVTPLLRAGFTLAALAIGSISIGADGLVTQNLRLLDGFCSNGAPLAAAAAVGNFGLTCTPGTVVKLISEVANNNTKTDKVLFEVVMPVNYVAGQSVTVTANANYSGSGTLTTKTLGLNAYEQAINGTGTTDINGTAAQVLTGTAADYAFVLDGTNLVPGDKVLLQFTITMAESASSAMTGFINSVRVG